MKPRILLVNESSFLSTGFAVYGREVMKRLYETGKYELAELGCYGPVNDPRESTIPWKYYPNLPSNDKELAEYNSRMPLSQFGEWRFEQTCLDFRPDITFDIRDFWMLESEQRSPFRPYFWWSIMPTVDSEPQEEQWIATYLDANSVFTYSDWSLDLLKKQGGGLIKTINSAPPGANLNVFKPIKDRANFRKRIGLDENNLIIGTVMRNQKRKLFPDLIKGFARFLKEAPVDVAKRAYLYLHTSYPDIGWDIPRLLKEHGVGHRTLFTYHCQRCRAVYPSLFMDARAACKNCGGPFASIPNSLQGVADEALAIIMNLFDVYVQYAICEGFGMPQVEAAACGVPIMSVDYSAMADVVRKVNGIPLNVDRFFRESETHCYRALPSEDDFVNKLIDFFVLPDSVRKKMGFDARQGVEQHYTYERTAKIWESHFDSIPIVNHNRTWLSPVKLHTPNLALPPNLTNEQFARWGLIHIAGRPDLLNSYTMLRMIRDLNYEATLDQGMGGFYVNEASTLGANNRWRPFTRENCTQEMLKLCHYRNHWENQRAALGK